MKIWYYKFFNQSDDEVVGSLKASSQTEAKAKIEELNGFQRHGYVGTTDLSKMRKTQGSNTIDSRRHNPVNTDSEGSDGSAEWRESLGAVAKNIRNQVSPPQSSGWATLYRVCGFIILLGGFIGTIGISQKNGEAGFQFAVVVIALTLSSFLAAFLIDVLTDMRHFLKRIAEKE